MTTIYHLPTLRPFGGGKERMPRYWYGRQKRWNKYVSLRKTWGAPRETSSRKIGLPSSWCVTYCPIIRMPRKKPSAGNLPTNPASWCQTVSRRWTASISLPKPPVRYGWWWMCREEPFPARIKDRWRCGRKARLLNYWIWRSWCKTSCSPIRKTGNTVWTYGRTHGPWHGTITWNRGHQNIRCFSSSIWSIMPTQVVPTSRLMEYILLGPITPIWSRGAWSSGSRKQTAHGPSTTRSSTST